MWLKILSSLGVGAIIGAIIGTVLGKWLQSKLEFLKERRLLYVRWIKSVKGFYESTAQIDPDEAKKLKEEFIDCLKSAYILAHPEVIKKANKFLESVKVGMSYADQKKETLLKEFFNALRKDINKSFWCHLFNKNKLEKEDIQFFISNDNNLPNN